MWLQITINRVKTLPQSLNSSMGQLLLIGSQIGYHTFEYQHTKKSFKNRVIFWGGGGSSKDHFGSQGGGVYWGPKKDHMIFEHSLTVAEEAHMTMHIRLWLPD